MLVIHVRIHKCFQVNMQHKKEDTQGESDSIFFLKTKVEASKRIIYLTTKIKKLKNKKPIMKNRYLKNIFILLPFLQHYHQVLYQ